MIATLPAVQKNCKHIHTCYSENAKRVDKRNANRRHRRALNRVTNAFTNDPERFEDEGFNAPSMSNWDID